MHSDCLHFKNKKKKKPEQLIKLFQTVLCTKYPAVTKETVQKDPQ